jgi:hypothetical protein
MAQDGVTLQATGSGLVKKHYVCELCGIEAPNFKNFKMHTAGKAHRAKVAAASAAKADAAAAAAGGSVAAAGPSGCTWHADMRQLSMFPMEHTILSTHTMVSDLEGEQLEAWRAYVRARNPGSAELVGIFEHVARAHPQHLRLKEFFETMEAYCKAAAHIARLQTEERDAARRAAKKAKRATAGGGGDGGGGGGGGEGGAPPPTPSSSSSSSSISTVYDMACGHGLFGILMAYRFQRVKVVCVDRQRRPAFDSVVEAFEARGEPADGSSGTPAGGGRRRVLPNLSFVEGDFTALGSGTPTTGGARKAEAAPLPADPAAYAAATETSPEGGPARDSAAAAPPPLPRGSFVASIHGACPGARARRSRPLQRSDTHPSTRDPSPCPSSPCHSSRRFSLQRAMRRRSSCCRWHRRRGGTG